METEENPKPVPVLVKIFAILAYISAVPSIIVGLLSLFLSELVISLIGVSGLVVVLIGVFFLGLGLLSILIGRGLMKGRNWARVLVIVLNIIFFIIAVMGLILIGLTYMGGAVAEGIINLLVAGYLLFNKNVKEAFA